MPTAMPVRISSIPNDYGEAARFLHSLGGMTIREATDAILFKDIVFPDAKTALDFVNLISRLGGHAYLNVTGSPATRAGAARPPVAPSAPKAPAPAPKPAPPPKPPEPKLLPYAKILLSDDDPFG